jgi:hypothetical protein
VAAVASIKVFDSVSVPCSVLEELQQLRALVEQLRRENQRLGRENWRLRGELDAARAGLDQAQRQARCWRAGRSGLDFVSQTLRAFANPLLPRPILLTPR